MATQSDVLAAIAANLQQAIDRKKPREQVKIYNFNYLIILYLFQTVKFELEGQVRACCIAKPFTYSDLLKSIDSLFGNHILTSLDSIRCVFSRDDALRLSVTNDDDLNKVIAIAEATQATKLNFLLTKKKDVNKSRIKTKTDQQNDTDLMPDDGQHAELDDATTDSPPPGTIAPQKRRTSRNTTSKSTTSKDGGLFIPESVSFCFWILNLIFLCRLMKYIQVMVLQ
jgi:hypothetical protein